MGESKSRIEPVTCPDCGLRGEVRLAQSGFKNNFPNVVRCKHRQGMAVVSSEVRSLPTCRSSR